MQGTIVTLRRALVAIAAAASMTALTAAPADAGTGRWQLEDYGQTACFSPHVTSSYYGIWISGQWRHTINVGASRLPAGGSFATSYAPIAPGSSDGEGSLAYVRVDIPAATPLGTYTARLWASDGKRTQTVPVTLTVKTRCGY